MFPEVLVDVLERVDLVAGQEQATKVSVPEVTEDEDYYTILPFKSLVLYKSGFNIFKAQ